LLNVVDDFLDRGVDKYKFKERIKKKKKKLEIENKSKRVAVVAEQELPGGKSPSKHAAAKHKAEISSGAKDKDITHHEAILLSARSKKLDSSDMDAQRHIKEHE